MSSVTSIFFSVTLAFCSVSGLNLFRNVLIKSRYENRFTGKIADDVFLFLSVVLACICVLLLPELWE